MAPDGTNSSTDQSRATIKNGDADTEPLNKGGDSGNIKAPSKDKDPLSIDDYEAAIDRRRQKRKAKIGKWLKYISLIVLVVQNAGQVLTMRYAKVRPGASPFLNTVAVFFGEVIKLFASLVLFFLSTKDARKSLSLLRKHFVSDFLDTLKVGVPAFIYTIQNFLLYVAIENLDAATYMVSYQMKILTTALFTVLMMKRRLSVAQWLSLVVLIAGVATVQISAKQASGGGPKQMAAPIVQRNETLEALASPSGAFTLQDSQNKTIAVALPAQSDSQNPFFGFICVILACFLSGFAGIYFEKVLKGSKVSVWLRNVQLASLSIPIGLIVIGVKDGNSVLDKGFLQGFDFVVWCVVLLQALGGLVVAVVIKYADNILKGFATSIAIVVSAIASIFIFALYPRLLFTIGAALVIAAVFLYGLFPYKSAEKKPLPASDKDESDQNQAANEEENDENDLEGIGVDQEDGDEEEDTEEILKMEAGEGKTKEKGNQEK